MKQKILLVGDSRICPQVAYVMDWQDFETVEQLTDAEKYRDYKIVVCAFKKQSKRLVKIKDKTLDIIYLDDICRKLDKEYSFAAQVAMTDPKSPWNKLVKQIISLRLVMWLLNGLRQRLTFRSQFCLKRVAPKFMKPSEMLLRVLYAKPTNIVCDRLEKYCFITVYGGVFGCCYHKAIVPFGNVQQLSSENIYDNARARIIKLSSLNHSFCFCNFKQCDYQQRAANSETDCKTLSTAAIPDELVLATDETCNLACPSCRKSHLIHNHIDNKKIMDFHKVLLQNGWLTKVRQLIIAGVGEVFYSPNYRLLLTQNLQCDKICIISNGTLFNEENWKLIKDKPNTVSVTISLDAATAETYAKLRGGDFAQLMHNLEFLSELRKAGKIWRYQLNFVVQRDNYREMIDFVNLATRLSVDYIHFMPIENWGTFSEAEFRKRSLIVRRKYLKRDFYTILKNPIFRNPIVDLIAFQPFLAASAKRYNERSEISDM